MKKILLLLCLFTLSSLSFAQQKGVEGFPERQQAIASKLPSEHTVKRIISFQDFLIEAEIFSSIKQLDTDYEYTKDMSELYSTFFVKKGNLDYKKEFANLKKKNTKYIFIAESSNHGTRAINTEVGNILRHLREIYPQEKILLANESTNLANTEASYILFPGDSLDNHIVPEAQKDFHKLASDLSIDILALDDTLLFFSEEGGLDIKMGNTGVHFTTEELMDLAIQYGEDVQPDDYINLGLIAHDFLSRSDWGVERRNDQWARHITSIEDFYDIIVVFVGNGHMTGYSSLSEKLYTKTSIYLYLYTKEQIEDEQFYEKANEIQANMNTSVPCYYADEVEDELIDECKMYPLYVEYLNEWLEKGTYPFISKYKDGNLTVIEHYMTSTPYDNAKKTELEIRKTKSAIRSALSNQK